MPVVKCQQLMHATTTTMIRILMIQPGFGGGKHGRRFQMLKEDPNFILCMPDIAKPVRGTSDVALGLKTLRTKMETFSPDILMVASRGGIYASAFLEQEQCNRITIPPIFYIGALQAKTFCEAKRGTHLILLCHGIRDDRNDIDDVRNSE